MASLAFGFQQPAHGLIPGHAYMETNNALHHMHQSQQMAHSVISSLPMTPQAAQANMFNFFAPCGGPSSMISPLLLQRNAAANAQMVANHRSALSMQSESPSYFTPPRSPTSLSAHSTEDGSDSPRTQSPASSRAQTTTPTGAKKMSLSSPSSSSSPSSPSTNNTIFPRRKAGQHARLNSKPVVLDETTLRKLFALPLHEAATSLGISATAMKSACRKLGIKKWPYRTVQSSKTAAARRAFAASGASSCSSPSSGSVTSSPSAPRNNQEEETSSAAGSLSNLVAAAAGGDSLSNDAALLTETMRLFRGRAEMDSQTASESEEASESKETPSKSSLAMLLN